jgi:hypothetical protein
VTGRSSFFDLDRRVFGSHMKTTAFVIHLNAAINDHDILDDTSVEVDRWAILVPLDPISGL